MHCEFWLAPRHQPVLELWVGIHAGKKTPRSDRGEGGGQRGSAIFLWQQHFVDDVNYAIGLDHVADRDVGDMALVVSDGP